jgi:hypothetical protein
MSKTKNIKDLLFKPLLQVGGEEQCVVIIYAFTTITSRIINLEGEETDKKIDTLNIFNVTMTIDTGNPVTETFQIQNATEFRKQFEIIEEVEAVQEEIMAAISILVDEMQDINHQLSMLTGQLDNYNHLVSAVKYLSKESDKINEGNLILAGSTNPLAHVVFKTISGKKDIIQNILEEEDILKIGGVLMEILSDKIRENLEDQDIIRKLAAEIEYKIIDAIPDHLKAGDINIDMNAIKEEILRLKNGEDNGYLQ